MISYFIFLVFSFPGFLIKFQYRDLRKDAVHKLVENRIDQVIG